MDSISGKSSVAKSIADSVERRSIDYVPPAERHGKAWHQTPFWLAGGSVLPSMLIGFIGPGLGLGIGWSLVAVICGMAFGTLFMALHANQGPHLGIPQMIQSRAQFGSRGATFPMMVGVIIYIGYNVFQFVFSGEVISTVAPGGKIWYIVVGIIALCIAVVGHDLLHVVQRWASIISLILFFVITLGIIIEYPIAGASPAETGWSLKAFLTAFAAAGGYQISYAIYVSDYSRYLPDATSHSKIILYTYFGGTVGAAWMGAIGALLGTYVGSDAIPALRAAGDQVIPGFGPVILFATLPAMLGTSGVNNYGAMLTGSTIVDGIRHIRPTVRTRIGGLVGVGLGGLLLSLLLPSNYLDVFDTFIQIMTYLLVPWTAVNLIDYYVVQKGRYSVADILDPTGGYGQWAWQGLTAYFCGFIAMIPFVSLSFYEGPIASGLGGADFAFIVGLGISGIIYFVLGRSRRALTVELASEYPEGIVMSEG